MAFRHATIEKNVILLMVLTLITVSIGGLVQIIPLFAVESTIERVEGVRPYSPLELAGRNIYIREGCYVCHSQQIRSFRDEAERYGHYSLAAESMYDRPFQWGSKRNGPDLARVGGKYSNDWHYAHLTYPQAMVPESLMPRYAFLATRPVDAAKVARHMRTNRALGNPYTEEQLANVAADLEAQADPQADPSDVQRRYPKAVQAAGSGRVVSEMDALVAYLQVLGTMVDFTNPANENLKQ